MKRIGILLVFLGVAALIYGGISYSRNRTVLQVGSLDVTTTESRNIPIPAIVGVVVLIGGAVLVAADRRRPRII
jgi:uncharacterized membrane protein YidH (DUF202 family)